MIVGIGNDIIEVEKIKNQITKDPGFKKSLFTENEITYCESKKSWDQNFAGRYAAKEAFFKALGTGWRNGMSYTDIEIVNDELGKPKITVSNKTKLFCQEQGITTIFVSISHIKEYATAYVVVENRLDRGEVLNA